MSTFHPYFMNKHNNAYVYVNMCVFYMNVCDQVNYIKNTYIYTVYN